MRNALLFSVTKSAMVVMTAVTVKFVTRIITLSRYLKQWNEQESPPAWTQEAYRRPRSKCSLCWWGGGGYPIQSWWGRGTPSSHGGGYPGYTPLHPDLAGVPPPPSRPGRGTPPTIKTCLGYPPTLDLAGVPPYHQDLARVPPTPDQTWQGYPPPSSRPGMGYSPSPPHTSVDRHTDSCQNITFPRTSYAGGKYQQIIYFFVTVCFFWIQASEKEGWTHQCHKSPFLCVKVTDSTQVLCEHNRRHIHYTAFRRII